MARSTRASQPVPQSMPQAAPLDPAPSSTATPAATPAPDTAQAIPLGHLLRLARVVGYGLLLLSFVDFLYVLFPMEIMDPVWEYQFTGDLIKLVPVPLLALVLVFWGDSEERQDIEWPIVWFLSWLTLIFSLILFLLLPLTAANTLRIHRFNTEQIESQVSQERQQLEANRTQIEAATTEQLASLIPTPDAENPTPALSPEDARAQILDNIEQAKTQADERAEQARNNVTSNLIKNSLKLLLEGAMGSFLFLYTWLVTRWARRGQGKRETQRHQGNPATAFGRRLGRMVGRKPKRMKHRIR